MAKWTIAQAKQQFSSMVSEAQKNPQVITKHGKKIAFVINADGYKTAPVQNLSILLGNIEKLKKEFGSGATLQLPDRLIDEIKDPFIDVPS